LQSNTNASSSHTRSRSSQMVGVVIPVSREENLICREEHEVKF